MPDYTTMQPSDMLAELGDDGAKWAEAFKQHAEKLGHAGMDESWLVGWFANAIEHAADVRRWRQEKAATATSREDVQDMRAGVSDERLLRAGIV